MKKLFIGLLIIGTVVITAFGVPNSIQYKGRLMESGVLVNGTKSFGFAIYDTPTDGSAIWVTTDVQINVIQGVYSVALGAANNPITPNVLAGDNAYLQVMVEGAALLPRMKINSVAYALQAGAVTGEDNVFPSEGNVGIGTVGPTYKLDVVGDIGLDATLYHNDDSNTYIYFAPDAVDIVAGGNSGFYLQGSSGKVGIGDNTPATKLEVAGTVSANAFVGDGSGLTGVASTDTGWDHTASENIVLGSNYLSGDGGDEGIFVSANGSVGIGTTDPSAKLHVYDGQMRVENTGGDAWVTMMNDAGIVGYFGVRGSGHATQANDTLVYSNGGSDIAIVPEGVEIMRLTSQNVGIGDANPATKLEVAGTVSANAYIKDGVALGGDGHSLDADDGSPADVVYVDAAGEVGIGTTAPAELLEIRSNASGTLSTKVKNENTGTAANSRFLLENDSGIQTDFRLYGSNTSGTLAGLNKADLSVILAQAGASGLLIDTAGADPIVFGIENVERMRIDSGGEVGIGTAEPSGNLHVYNSSDIAKMYLESYSANANLYLKAAADGTDGDPQIYFFQGGSASHKIYSDTSVADDPLHFYDYALGDIAMTIKNGKVGIGTVDPATELEVAGTVSANAFIKDGVALAGDGHSLDADDGDPVNVVYVDAAGEVGIGTTDPDTLLHVVGGTTDNLPTSFLTLRDSGGGVGDGAKMDFAYAGSDILNASIYAQSKTGGGGSLTLATAASDGVTPSAALTITKTGSVGIGTTDPNYPLEVRSPAAVADYAAYILAGGSAGYGLKVLAGASSGGTQPVLDAMDGDGDVLFRVRADGDIGIGTTDPVDTMHINKPGDGYGIGIWNSAGYRVGGIYNDDSHGGQLILRDASNNLDVQLSADSAANSWINNGSVGIGTTTPGAKLHISNNLNNTDIDAPYLGTKVLVGDTTDTDGNTAGYLFRGSVGSAYMGGMYVEYEDHSAYQSKLHFATRSGGSFGSKMTLDKDGKVGIGKTNPTSALDVVGNIAIPIDYHLLLGGKSFVRLDDPSNDIYFGTGSGGDYYFFGDGMSGYGKINAGYGYFADRVGIGDASPSAYLSIESDTPVTVNQWLMDFHNVNGATRGGFYINNQDNGQMYLYDSSTTLKTFLNAGGYSFINGGDVGIGTESPDGTLHVHSAGSADNNYNDWADDLIIQDSGTAGDDAGLSLIADSTSGVSGVTFGDTANLEIGGIWYYHNGNYMRFRTNSAEAMRIDSNGDVGIGTTDPTTRLTVRKPINEAEYGSGTRMIDLMSYFPDYDEETVKASIYAGVSGQTTLQTTRGYMAFLTSAYSPTSNENLTEKMRIESDGRVGIGTTNPNAMLHLSQTGDFAANPTLALGSTGTTGFYEPVYGDMRVSIGGTARYKIDSGAVSSLTNYGFYLQRDAGSSTDPVYAFSGDSTTGMGRAAANELSLITGGSEAVRIDSDGSVGIGTTSPGKTLDVRGNGMFVIDKTDGSYPYAFIGFDSTVDEGIFKVGRSRGNGGGAYGYVASIKLQGDVIPNGSYSPQDKWGIRLNQYGSADSNTDLSFYDYVNSRSVLWLSRNGSVGIGQNSPTGLLHVSANALVVNSDGNVGIGTTSPLTDLEVSRSGDGSLLMSSAVLRVANNGTSSQHALAEFESAGGYAVITNQGKVGIGVTAPGGLLEIAGSDPGMILSSTAGTTDRFRLFVDDSNDYNTHFQTNASSTWYNRMVIDRDSGNVGIGTAAPNAKLEVIGTVSANAYVTAGVPADYVFEADYNLKTIEEQAAFMWANKHLPAIQGAAELDGKINIAVRLEQAVEELEKAHVYIEQMNKKNQDLAEENQMLKQKDNELEARIVKLENR
ncbi:hypothetical protein ACFL57_02710 [Candidatus Margulisiibacteriota bacterium]